MHLRGSLGTQGKWMKIDKYGLNQGLVRKMETIPLITEFYNVKNCLARCYELSCVPPKKIR